MKEYVIWGKSPKSSGSEDLLVSENAGIKTREHAENVMALLESNHGCFDCRIQVLDLGEPFEWNARAMVNV